MLWPPETRLKKNRIPFSSLSTQLEGVGASQLLGVHITAWCWYAALVEPGTPRQVPWTGSDAVYPS